MQRTIIIKKFRESRDDVRSGGSPSEMYCCYCIHRNGRATIVANKKNALIGQRKGFSTTDLAKLRKLYGCDDAEVCGDDYGDLCPIYSMNGGCQKYREFMGRHCGKTCELCKKDSAIPGGCRDKDSRFDRASLYLSYL